MSARWCGWQGRGVAPVAPVFMFGGSDVEQARWEAWQERFGWIGRYVSPRYRTARSIELMLLIDTTGAELLVLDWLATLGSDGEFVSRVTPARARNNDDDGTDASGLGPAPRESCARVLRGECDGTCARWSASLAELRDGPVPLEFTPAAWIIELNRRLTLTRISNGDDFERISVQLSPPITAAELRARRGEP